MYAGSEGSGMFAHAYAQTHLIAFTDAISTEVSCTDQYFEFHACAISKHVLNVHVYLWYRHGIQGG